LLRVELLIRNTIGRCMFNSKDYRGAKAAEHQNRARASHNADEISEHRKLERTFSELADNAAWMEENTRQRIHPVTQDR
jgi:hypothetical protein